MPDYEQKAIKAVFYAHPDRLQRIIDEGYFQLDLLEDIKFLSKPFPIWRITQCWEEALGNDASKYTDKKTVADFMARNQKVKAIFQKNFDIEYSPINYQIYWEGYYSEDPEEYDSEIISSDEAKALSKLGTTQLDVELYCAVVKFDIPRIKELLEKGANPRAAVDMDDRWDEGAYGRISRECAFLCTCRLAYAWKTVEEPPLDDNEIGDLIGWAAHESVYRCMERYASLYKSDIPRHRMSLDYSKVLTLKGDSSRLFLDKCLNCFPKRKRSLEDIVSDMRILGKDDFTIEFEGPDDGWFDIYFKVKGKKSFLIEVSDVYPPFLALKKWLEDMMNYSIVTSECINIDCERYNACLSYDYIGYKDGKDRNWAVALIQIGNDIDKKNKSKEYEPVIQMVVPIHLFVSKFYYSLKDYIYSNRRVFSKQWCLPNCDYFEFRKFIGSVISKTIEHKLEKH